MFLFIIGVMALLVAAVGIFLGVKGRSRKGNFLAIGVVSALIGIVLIVCSSLSTVPISSMISPIRRLTMPWPQPWQNEVSTWETASGAFIFISLPPSA